MINKLELFLMGRNPQPIIKVENLSKEYRLGGINHGTLYRDLQSFSSRFFGRIDPNTKVGHKEEHGLFKALQDVSFSVNPGDVLGVIGRNGAGKSTLLKILSRITAPTKGTIKIKGRMASLLEVGTGFHPEIQGLYIKCSLRELIQSIVVGPNTDWYFHMLMKRLIARFELTINVEHSKLSPFGECL